MANTTTSPRTLQAPPLKAPVVPKEDEPLAKLIMSSLKLAVWGNDAREYDAASIDWRCGTGSACIPCATFWTTTDVLDSW